LADLPVQVPASWSLKVEEDAPLSHPSDLSKRNCEGLQVLAKALVFTRIRNEAYRRLDVQTIRDVIGTENRDFWATFRAFGTCVIAADMVELSSDDDQVFRKSLEQMLDPNY
jgi:hypothetical protein